MKFEISEYMSGLFLFSGIDGNTLTEILKTVNPEIIKFRSGVTIYSPSEFEKKIGFIVSGKCEVQRLRHDGGCVPLNVLHKNDSFGIIAILANEEEFPTRIVSKGVTEIMFVCEKDFRYLIGKFPKISENVIKFLSRKVVFLNQKIATFSSESVVEKLASYIYSEAKKAESLEISFNCKKSADAINAGRASLYRALDKLTSDDIIELENKKLKIKNYEKLERILK